MERLKNTIQQKSENKQDKKDKIEKLEIENQKQAELIARLQFQVQAVNSQNATL